MEKCWNAGIGRRTCHFHWVERFGSYGTQVSFQQRQIWGRFLAWKLRLSSRSQNFWVFFGKVHIKYVSTTYKYKITYRFNDSKNAAFIANTAFFLFGRSPLNRGLANGKTSPWNWSLEETLRRSVLRKANFKRISITYTYYVYVVRTYVKGSTAVPPNPTQTQLYKQWKRREGG